MARPRKVAIITGGGSGIGLEVATHLHKTTEWELHIIDIDETRRETVKAKLDPDYHFHVANVNDYSQLATTFDHAFNEGRRLNFVFANAGIVERTDFYSRHPAGRPPPPLDKFSIDIDLKSVVNTAYLALHYFRQSPPNEPKHLITTGSIGCLYPCFGLPMYTSAKHGVLGFTRAIADRFFKEGIRANVILPGVVVTNLLDPDEFKDYPEGTFTPIDFVAETTVRILQGSDITDAHGQVIQSKELYGKAIEINVRNLYFREQPEWCDDTMKAIMDTTETHSYSR